MVARAGPCRGLLMPLLRLLGGAMGLTVIALGAYELAEGSHSLKSIVDNVYRIVFGVLIVLAEMRLTTMLTWFSFLSVALVYLSSALRWPLFLLALLTLFH